MGDRLLMPFEISLTLPGSAQVLFPPEAALFCSNVLTNVPPCAITCAHASECSVIDCEILEGRDVVLADPFSNGTRKEQ